MKIALQYVNDMNGQTTSVQVPLADWEKIIDKLKSYEQALQLMSDLKEAYKQVKEIRAGKGTKQALNEFLNEL